MMRFGRRFLDFWFEPIARERLLLWQQLFTLTFIIFIAQWSIHGREWLTNIGYHVSQAATNARDPSPLPLLPEAWLAPFLAIMFGSALLVMLDYAGRVPKLVVLCCSVYIQLADQSSSFTLNKLYNAGFFVIAFAPRPRSLPAGIRQSAWPVRFLQTTLLIQYFEAGLCKAYRGDWLHKFDILYGDALGIYRTEFAGWLVNHMPHAFWFASSMFALTFELTAPLLFMVKRLRWIGIAAGTAMHLVIAAMMKDLIFFSLQIISFYALFLPDHLCRTVTERMRHWLSPLEPYRIGRGSHRAVS